MRASDETAAPMPLRDLPEFRALLDAIEDSDLTTEEVAAFREILRALSCGEDSIDECPEHVSPHAWAAGTWDATIATVRAAVEGLSR